MGDAIRPAVPEIGLFLSSEEHGPGRLVEIAQLGEAAGFGSVMISDHFHPWLDRQGQSPFVWSVIGAIAASTRLRVMTGVTCPTVRIHPVIVAQAAATSACLLDGRFTLGVGSGEALNEHVLGDRWPPTATRLEMLEEAVSVLRALWTGDKVTHRGHYFTVENARLYTLPASPPPVLVSAFGERSRAMAARIGDGLVTDIDSRDFLRRYREEGGTGPVVGFLKVCWDADEGRAVKLAHDVWPTECLPGQLGQELPTPTHFEQAASLVTEEMVANRFPCGPDPERHANAISRMLDAGFDEVYVSQIGDDQAGFLEFFGREVRPRIGA